MLTATQEQVYSLGGRFRLLAGDGWSHLSGMDWPFRDPFFAEPPTLAKLPTVTDLPRHVKVVTNFPNADVRILCQKWRDWTCKYRLYNSYTTSYCKAVGNSMGHLFALLDCSNPHYNNVLAIGHAFVSTNELIGPEFFDITTLIVNPAHLRRDYGSMLLESMLLFALSCNHPHCFIHVPDDCYECLGLCDKYRFEECRHFDQELVRQDDHDIGIYHSTVAYTTLQRVITRPFESCRYRPDFVYRHNFPGKLVT